MACDAVDMEVPTQPHAVSSGPAWRPPPAVEVCDDGLDDDLDGLVDCEDSDCAASSLCMEDCDDGVDNDVDGLTDCLDDDCWGLGCHPHGVVAWVETGEWSVSRAEERWEWDSGGYTADIDRDATAMNVVGKVRVLDPGARWSTSAGTTCSWSVDSAVMSTRDHIVESAPVDLRSYHSNPATRTGFYIESGCMLDSSAFLPTVKLGGRATASAVGLGRQWYAPGSPGTTASWDATFAFSSGGYHADVSVDDRQFDAVLAAQSPGLTSRDPDGDGWVGPADCNEASPVVHSGAAEVCNGIDDDCDGLVDDADPDRDASTGTPRYADSDGDGFGDATTIVWTCAPGPGAVDDNTDCDDTDPDLIAATTWHHDGDGDGVGAGAPLGPATCAAPSGDAAPSTAGLDCDDLDPDRSPLHKDWCGDGLDQDCDGIDPPCASSLGLMATAAASFIAPGLNNWVADDLDAADVDGDGQAEILLLSPSQWGSSPGQLDVLSASSRGIVDVQSSSLATLSFDEGSSLGSLAAVVDIDGDERQEVLVGQPTYGPGSAYLLRGPLVSGRMEDQARLILEGSLPHDAIGVSTADLGDTDSDGIRDLAVGGSGDREGGSIYVLSAMTEGRHAVSDIASATILGNSAYDYVQMVAGPGDLNGDGTADLVHDGMGGSSPGVHLMPFSGVRTAADADVGLSRGLPAAVGDMDSDGLADFAMWRGSEVELHTDLSGTSTASFTGFRHEVQSMAGLVDINGDGAVDLAVGSNRFLSDGQVYLFFGPHVGAIDADDADRRIDVPANIELGSVVGGAGDVDGDGLDDLLVGSRYDAFATSDGTAHLILATDL